MSTMKMQEISFILSSLRKYITPKSKDLIGTLFINEYYERLKTYYNNDVFDMVIHLNKALRGLIVLDNHYQTKISLKECPICINHCALCIWSLFVKEANFKQYQYTSKHGIQIGNLHNPLCHALWYTLSDIPLKSLEQDMNSCEEKDINKRLELLKL